MPHMNHSDPGSQDNIFLSLFLQLLFRLNRRIYRWYPGKFHQVNILRM